MIGLDRARLGVVTHQPGVAAQPDPAARIREHAIDRVGRQSLRARHRLEADRIRSCRRPDHLGETTAVGPHPDSIPRIDRNGIHRVDGQRGRIGGVVAEHLDDRSIRARQIETTAIGADPEVSAPVLGDGGDIGGTDCARCRRAERQLADQTRQRIKNVHATTVGADPELAGTCLENRHDARRTRAVRVARLHRDGLELPAGTELLDSARHGTDPQRPEMILVQRHDALVADGVGSARHRVDRGRTGGIAVEQRQSATHGSDPHPVVGRVGKRGDLPVPHPLRPMITELPAARIPAADPACVSSDPDQACLVLVERHDERVAQRLGIGPILFVVGELSGRTIQQVQSAGRPDPQVSCLVLERCPHIVIGERRALVRIVTKTLQDAAIMIHSIQAAVERADPQGAAAILEDA